jgi:DNA-binding MarR family transcriptional regulator
MARRAIDAFAAGIVESMPPASGGSEGVAEQAVEVQRAVESLVLTWSRAEDALHMQISAAQLRALLAVGRRGPLNLTQLAEELGTIPSWASRLCDRLVAAGYLERRSSDQSGREVVLTLRGDGRRLLAELETRRRDALMAVLAKMSDVERRAFARGVKAFARLVDGADVPSEASA